MECTSVNLEADVFTALDGDLECVLAGDYIPHINVAINPEHRRDIERAIIASYYAGVIGLPSQLLTAISELVTLGVTECKIGLKYLAQVSGLDPHIQEKIHDELLRHDCKAKLGIIDRLFNRDVSEESVDSESGLPDLATRSFVIKPNVIKSNGNKFTVPDLPISACVSPRTHSSLPTPHSPAPKSQRLYSSLESVVESPRSFGGILSRMLSPRTDKFTICKDHRGQRIKLGKNIYLVSNGNTKYAAKQINWDRGLAPELIRDVSVLGHNTHPNVVNLIARMDNHYILELAYDSLLGYGNECTNKPQLAMQVGADIGAALMHIHGQGIVHGRVNTKHILVFKDKDTIRCKLSNFGQVRYFQHTDDTRTDIEGLFGVIQGLGMFTGCSSTDITSADQLRELFV